MKWKNKGNLKNVLIVAKCIVNIGTLEATGIKIDVLIVAKCIVNLKVQNVWNKGWGINSSKI